MKSNVEGDFAIIPKKKKSFCLRVAIISECKARLPSRTYINSPDVLSFEFLEMFYCTG